MQPLVHLPAGYSCCSGSRSFVDIAGNVLEKCGQYFTDTFYRAHVEGGKQQRQDVSGPIVACISTHRHDDLTLAEALEGLAQAHQQYHNLVQPLVHLGDSARGVKPLQQQPQGEEEANPVLRAKQMQKQKNLQGKAEAELWQGSRPQVVMNLVLDQGRVHDRRTGEPLCLETAW